VEPPQLELLKWHILEEIIVEVVIVKRTIAKAIMAAEVILVNDTNNLNKEAALANTTTLGKTQANMISTEIPISNQQIMVLVMGLQVRLQVRLLE
jgi:hypothetical protein